MPRPRLEAGEYAVEAVQPDQRESIRLWRNAQLSVLRQSVPITRTQQDEYFQRHVWPAMDAQHPSDVLLGFYRFGTLIGYGGLVHIAWEHQRAEVSFLLDSTRTADPAEFARHFSSFLRLMKALAFDDLGLHRLTTETFSTRPQVVSILESMGFRREGLLREHVIKNQSYLDSFLHGCLSAYER